MMIRARRRNQKMAEDFQPGEDRDWEAFRGWVRPERGYPVDCEMEMGPDSGRAHGILPFGIPVVHEAARYGDLHDLVCLVEKGGDVNEWEGGYQPLLRALDPNNDKMGRGCQAEVVA